MNTLLMSEETQRDFSESLKKLTLIFRLGVTLILGAFALGGWVTNLQLNATKMSQQVETTSSRVRELELKEAADTEKLKTILTTVDRIDRKLNKYNE